MKVSYLKHKSDRLNFKGSSIVLKSKPFTLKIDTRKQDDGNPDDPNDDIFYYGLYKPGEDVGLNDVIYDFDIDWGDGTDIQSYDNQRVIDDSILNSGSGYHHLEHQYPTPGEYTIKVYGRIGSITTSFMEGKAKYIEVIQWGNGIWYITEFGLQDTENLSISATDTPKFQRPLSFRGFLSYSGIESVPSNIFDKAINNESFSQTFNSSENLASIPSGLFNNTLNNLTFNQTFSGCISLTSIPSGLFDNSTNNESFNNTFSGCVGLTSIPSGLFDNAINNLTFTGTFFECTGITEVPANLFDNSPNNTSYTKTFEGCTNLNIVYDASTWSMLNVTRMWRTFANCGSIDVVGIENWEPFKIDTASNGSMVEMFIGSTLPTQRYSDLLVNWASKAASFENTGITFHGGNSKYNSAGQTARNTLTSSPYNWNITDGGLEV